MYLDTDSVLLIGKIWIFFQKSSQTHRQWYDVVSHPHPSYNRYPNHVTLCSYFSVHFRDHTVYYHMREPFVLPCLFAWYKFKGIIHRSILAFHIRYLFWIGNVKNRIKHIPWLISNQERVFYHLCHVYRNLLLQIGGSRLAEHEIMTLARHFSESQDEKLPLDTLVSVVQEQLRKTNFENFSKLTEGFMSHDTDRSGFVDVEVLRKTCRAFHLPVPDDLLRTLLFR